MPRWLRLPDRRFLTRPLPWLIALALVTVLGGVTLIARIALNIASPAISRYDGDLAARVPVSYDLWSSFGPLLPAINPEVIEAAEELAPPDPAPGNPQPVDTVPIAVIGLATPTPQLPLAVVPSPSPTSTEAPPPSPVVSPTATATRTTEPIRAPTQPPPSRTAAPATATAIRPTTTPVTAPDPPSGAPPTSTPLPPTATTAPPRPPNTPAPTSTLVPTSPPAPTSPPGPTSTPLPTSTPTPPLLSFVDSAITASETQGSATVRLRLSDAYFLPVTVAYATGGGSATPDSDYTATSGTLTFTPGEREKSFTIPIRADALDEPNETVEISLSVLGNAILSGPSTAVLTITDSNAPPLVRFSGAARTVAESVGTTTLTVELSEPSAIDVSVPFVVGGTAASDDHNLRASALVIPAGSTSARLRFSVTADWVDEDDESVVVTLGTPRNADLSSPSVFVLTITDDDTAAVTLRPDTLELEEGEDGIYSIVLESQPVDPVTVDLLPDGQLLLLSQSQLTFTASNWNTPRQVRLRAIDDAIDETSPHTGTLRHSVRSLDPRYNGIATAPLTARIIDDDTAGVIITAPPLLTLTEADGPGQSQTYTIVLRSQPVAPVTLSLGSPDGQVLVSPATLTIAPESWNTPRTITVTAIDDPVDERGGRGGRPATDPHTGTVAHVVSSADPLYNGFAVADLVWAITDNDSAGVIIEPRTVAVSEALPAVAATYAVRLDSQPTAPVTVAINFDPQELVVQGGPTSPVTLSFQPEDWNVAQTVRVAPLDDAIDEDGRGNTLPHTSTITHALVSADPNYDDATSGLPVDDVTVSITDNDTAGVTITPPAPATVVEGATITYTLRLDSQPTSPVDLSLSITPTGVASVAPVSLTVGTGPDDWRQSRTITITALDDAFDGPAESLPVTVSHVLASADPNYDDTTSGFAVDDVVISVIDNDTAGINLGPLSITTPLSETVTAPNHSATFTVTLRSRPRSPVTVTLLPDDEVTLSTSVLTFTSDPLAWRTPQTVTVTAVDDVIAENAIAPSTIRIATASADPRYAGLTSVLNLDVEDNDLAGVVFSAPSGLFTTEGGGVVTFTLRLLSQPESPVSLNLLSSNPAEGQVISPTLPITFTPATWDVPRTVTVAGVDDSVRDGNQTYTVTVQIVASDAPKYTTDPDQEPPPILPLLTLTNLDDEPLVVSVADAAPLGEGDGGLRAFRFPVTLSRTSPFTVTVGYTTYPLSATAGSDFVVATGRLTFAPGTLTRPLDVFVIGDTVYEPDELFGLRLTRVEAPGDIAALGVTEGLGRILNDDEPGFRFARADTLVDENSGLAEVVVQLDEPVATVVMVAYSTIDSGTAAGTAQPGVDYLGVSGTLIFNSGEVTKTFTVPILDNDAVEDDPYETVRLALFGASGAPLGSPSVATITIVEDGLDPATATPGTLVTGGPLATPENGFSYAGSGGGTGSTYLAMVVPCSWPTGQPLTIELWSPALHTDTGSVDALLATGGSAGSGQTTFELYAAGTAVDPTGAGPLPGAAGSLHAQVYSATATAEGWEPFYTLATPAPCGRYVLRSASDGADENWWAVRATPSGGAEAVQFATLLSSVGQISPPGESLCTTGWFYVPPDTASLRLRNFDLDAPPGGSDTLASLRYYGPGEPFDPRGTIGGRAGSASQEGTWAEDTILWPDAGWWRVVICTSDHNRLSFVALGDDLLLPLFASPPAETALQANLAVTPTVATAGDPVGVGLTYGVSGGRAYGATITVTLPPVLAFAGDPCAGVAVPCVASASSVMFTPGDLASGSGGAYSFSTTVDADAAADVVAIQVAMHGSDVAGNRLLARGAAVLTIP